MFLACWSNRVERRHRTYGGCELLSKYSAGRMIGEGHLGVATERPPTPTPTAHACVVTAGSFAAFLAHKSQEHAC